MATVVGLLSLLAFGILTVGTAVFVAAEFSLTALERGVVEANARSGNRRDRSVRDAHRTLTFQLSGAQLGISITTLATGYLAEPVLARWFRPALHSTGLTTGAATAVALLLALVVATSISMVLGELVPKNVAVAYPLPTARSVAGIQLLFSRMAGPAIRLTNGTANAILRRIGVQPAERLQSARSPTELASVVRNSARSGALDPTTAALIDRSLRFGTLTAEELMTPRAKIVTLTVDDTVADLVTVAMETGFSRFPVVNGDLDETTGIVHVRQVFDVAAGERAGTPVTSIARPAATVPSALDGDAVMARVRASDLQVALVIDEYGGTAGMLTTEDLIEEIVGAVRDEHDDPGPDVVAGPAGWQLSGLLRIDEVATQTGFRAPDGPYETIGGLLLRELGHIPRVGETVVVAAFDPDGREPSNWLARITRMDGRRIDTLTLSPLDGSR